MFPGDDMSELVRAKIGQCARRSADIAQVNDPAAVKVGTAQKGMTAKPREAPAFGSRKKEQALSPADVGYIEPELAPLRFEWRPVQQLFAVMEKPLSASGRNRTVRGNNDLSRTERECKK